jgi:hypothetical protein
LPVAHVEDVADRERCGAEEDGNAAQSVFLDDWSSKLDPI